MDVQGHLFSLHPLFLILILLLSGQKGLQMAEGSLQHKKSGQHTYFRPTKLFVFGDSYADTGNIRKSLADSWKDPYGITFPGKPAGRFSDGRVLTDYIAKYLGVKSPVPYRLRKYMPKHLKYGMNFAFGGTGVFDTSVAGPNMTTQIDLLQQLINDKVYSTADLSSSVAYVSVAGNDYSHYIHKNGTAEGFPAFIASVVKQITTDLKRIQSLGLKKIAVNSLEPLGCLPQTTAPSFFQGCNTSVDSLTAFHNQLLNQIVTKLNQQSKNNYNFIILDLYSSFMSILKHPATHNFQNQFKPCCAGISSGFSCGSVDENKVKKYSVCDDPRSAFFWDLVHPTQAGWHAVYNQLRGTGSFQQLVY